MNNDLENYDRIISELAYSMSNELISNRDADHAKILVPYLLKTAISKVCIFSSKLTDSIYDDANVINAFREFASVSDGKIHILLQEPDKFNGDSPIAELLEELDANIVIKSVVNDSDKAIKEHFIVNDNNGFRFCQNKGTPSAVASFNQKNTAENLLKQFDILFNRAKDFSVSNKEEATAL